MEGQGEAAATSDWSWTRPQNPLKRARCAQRGVGPARVRDASAGGLGLAIRRGDAPPGEDGMLVACSSTGARTGSWACCGGIILVDEEIRWASRSSAAKPRKALLTRQSFRGTTWVWERGGLRGKRSLARITAIPSLLEPKPAARCDRPADLPQGMAKQRRAVRCADAGGKPAHRDRPLAFENGVFPARACSNRWA